MSHPLQRWGPPCPVAGVTWQPHPLKQPYCKLQVWEKTSVLGEPLLPPYPSALRATMADLAFHPWLWLWDIWLARGSKGLMRRVWWNDWLDSPLTTQLGDPRRTKGQLLQARVPPHSCLSGIYLGTHHRASWVWSSVYKIGSRSTSALGSGSQRACYS